jgi:DNA primase
VQRLFLAQPELQLRGATASLERQRTLKRCRHLLDAWSAQRLATLEQCIAQLLQEPSGPAPEPPLLDMEQRIDQLFASLNGDALRFQETYYSERRYLDALDQRRCVAFGEAVTVPAA